MHPAEEHVVNRNQDIGGHANRLPYGDIETLQACCVATRGLRPGRLWVLVVQKRYLEGRRHLAGVCRQEAGCSCPDGGHQRLDADDVHDAGQIVGQHVQSHFGGDAR